MTSWCATHKTVQLGAAVAAGDNDRCLPCDAYGVQVKTGVGNAVSSVGEKLKNTRAGQRYQEHLAEQTKKQISDPKAAAGTDGKIATGTASTLSTSTVANDITTGGTRNTSITLNISKFWEDVNVFPAEDIDMNTLSRKVLEAINRSLEAATAAAR